MNRHLRVAAAVAAAVVLQGCITSRGPRPLPPEPGVRPTAAFASPLPGFEILSPFGSRGRRFHTGVDLRARRGGGDPVLASRSGRVTRAERFSSYGLFIEIRHEDGFSTRYAHLKR